MDDAPTPDDDDENGDDDDVICCSSDCHVKAWVQISNLIECKIVIIFLPISLNICFGCSKEISH